MSIKGAFFKYCNFCDLLAGATAFNCGLRAKIYGILRQSIVMNCSKMPLSKVHSALSTARKKLLKFCASVKMNDVSWPKIFSSVQYMVNLCFDRF